MIHQRQERRMKNLITTSLLAGFSACVCGQGYIDLDNNSNSSTSPTATANGLFWLATAGNPVLIAQDFNAAFYGGTDSGSLSPIATFLLSNGTAAHDNGFGIGTFTDPSGPLSYPISGSTDFAFFQIQAWTGTFNSYAAAVSAGAAASQSPIFVNPVSVPPGTPPSLTSMPAMVLGVPEPSTFSLIGLGLLALLSRFSSRRAA